MRLRLIDFPPKRLSHSDEGNLGHYAELTKEDFVSLESYKMLSRMCLVSQRSADNFGRSGMSHWTQGIMFRSSLGF
jgi:hypothetical protein